MTGWVTEEEPDWTTADLQWAIDYQAEQDIKCPGCGHPRDESMAPETDDGPFYEVHKLACHACYTRDLHARDAAEENHGQLPPGRYYSVTPKR